MYTMVNIYVYLGHLHVYYDQHTCIFRSFTCILWPTYMYI